MFPITVTMVYEFTNTALPYRTRFFVFRGSRSDRVSDLLDAYYDPAHEAFGLLDHAVILYVYEKGKKRIIKHHMTWEEEGIYDDYVYVTRYRAALNKPAAAA